MSSKSMENTVPREKDCAAKLMYECEICKCGLMPYNEQHIMRHNNGKRHQRLAQLVLNQSQLELFGASYDRETNRYVCSICDFVLEHSLKKIKRHFKYEHKRRDDISSDVEVMEVVKVFKPKLYYSTSYDLSKDTKNFKLLEAPVTLVEGMGNCVGLLRFNVIPEDETPRLYCMASVLEKNGKAIARGERVGGSRMVMFGLFEHAQLGWFSHPQFCLYDLAEKFASEISGYFKRAFPTTMERLERVLINEGIPEGECRFGGTPFTCFSLTRDYICNPHDDVSNSGFGIILWLYPYGGVEVRDFPSIWLPQYHVYFKPPNGAAFVVNCNSTVHCTTSRARIGTLGMAFVQKRNVLMSLKKTLEQPQCGQAIAYMNAKERYERRRIDCQGLHVAAPFYSEGRNSPSDSMEKLTDSSHILKKMARSNHD